MPLSDLNMTATAPEPGSRHMVSRRQDQYLQVALAEAMRSKERLKLTRPAD